MKLEALKISSVFNLIGEAFMSSVRPTVVVDCREAKAVKIEQAYDWLRAKNMLERVIFVHELEIPSKFSSVLHEVTWSKLTVETQEKLINKKVIFQGYPVT